MRLLQEDDFFPPVLASPSRCCKQMLTLIAIFAKTGDKLRTCHRASMLDHLIPHLQEIDISVRVKNTAVYAVARTC